MTGSELPQQLRKRARKLKPPDEPMGSVQQAGHDAADEIERLRDVARWCYEHITDPHDAMDAVEKWPWLEVSDE